MFQNWGQSVFGFDLPKAETSSEQMQVMVTQNTDNTVSHCDDEVQNATRVGSAPYQISHQPKPV